jgi:hypothetical protein
MMALVLAGLAVAAPVPTRPAVEPSYSALVGTWRGSWDGIPFRATFFPDGRWRCVWDPEDGNRWEGTWWAARGELWVREWAMHLAEQGPSATYHFTGTLDRLRAVPGCHDETPFPATMVLRRRLGDSAKKASRTLKKNTGRRGRRGIQRGKKMARGE